MPSSPESISDRLLDARIALRNDEVSDASADLLVSQLIALSADDPDSDICLCVDAPGIGGSASSPTTSGNFGAGVSSCL